MLTQKNQKPLVKVETKGFPSLPPLVSEWFLDQANFILAHLPEDSRLQSKEWADLFLKLWTAPVAPGDPKSQWEFDELEVVVTMQGTEPFTKRGPRLKIQDFNQEQKAFGTVDIIYEKMDSFGIYRLNVCPGSKIPLHRHEVMKEAEMILGPGLVLNGQPVIQGQQMIWIGGEPHEYINQSSGWSTILCIDAPPFIPEDEIEIV